MKGVRVLTLSLALACGACAQLPESEADGPREAPVYRTGSNIPMHESPSTSYGAPTPSTMQPITRKPAGVSN